MSPADVADITVALTLFNLGLMAVRHVIAIVKEFRNSK